jgi:hypothetical protein
MNPSCSSSHTSCVTHVTMHKAYEMLGDRALHSAPTLVRHAGVRPCLSVQTSQHHSPSCITATSVPTTSPPPKKNRYHHAKVSRLTAFPLPTHVPR